MYSNLAKLGKVAMGVASRYWFLVGIDSFGNCRTKEFKENRTFFQEQFPGVADSVDVPHRDIQRQLMQWFQFDDACRQIAESCLRCFISNQIQEICLVVEQKFGKKHDFTSAELLPLVLDDIHRLRRTGGIQTTEASLTTRILQTFDPEKGNLSTWTSRMLKSDRTVKRFLLEHGIEQVTDWMILNYTSCGRLERILSGFDRTPEEISFALQLLDSYHQVYRTQILEQRQTGSRNRYPDPTAEQLQQIAERLRRDVAYNAKTRRMSPEQVLKELQDLASLLRAERIRASQGSSPLDFFHNEKQTINSQNEDVEQSGFLADYRQQFDTCLAQSVEQVIQTRFTYLQGKKTEKAQKKAENYLRGLDLFHCHGVPMKEIAPQLGLTDQPHLSRLLELKNLRSDIGRSTLSCLQKCVLELARFYLNPDQLQNLNSKVQALLGEEIDTVIKEAEKEASTGHNRVMNSQLAQQICNYLNSRKEEL